MRQLTLNESLVASGGNQHDVMVVDLVAAAQSFLLLLTLADQNTFRYGAIVTGMTGGTVGGAYIGYVTFGGSIAGGFGALGAGAIGAIAGGLAFKAAANFMVASYNWIIT